MRQPTRSGSKWTSAPRRTSAESLYWETAYATAYQIQVSSNGTTWNTAYSTTAGAGGVETHNFAAASRYVRMYGTARATQWGYPLWEFRVLTGTPPPGGGNGASSLPTTSST